MQLRAFHIIFCSIALCLSACERRDTQADQPLIATTTSYLEAAAADVLETRGSMLRLAEPGTCPGHFDIRPSEVRRLRMCCALLRFDFQKSLDAKLRSIGEHKLRVCEVAVNGGMGRPETYFSTCEQVASHLIAAGMLDRTAAESRLRAIKARLAVLSGEITNRVAAAGLVRAPVIASQHQQDFCKWLGLDVVAIFRGSDTASIREIAEAISAGRLAKAGLVIANLPEGRRTADALAARLGARVVVFENFPLQRNGAVSFDDMVTSNLDKLLGRGPQ